MTDLVTFERDGGVARITMDDGKVNVMSLAMLEALRDAFRRAEAERAITVLRSARPGIFSAGFDLKVFAANTPDASHAMVRAGAELALAILEHPHPVIGVCEGHAYPMGAFLLLASDIRIAAEAPFRIGLNEVAIGIPVPSFAIELARQRLHPAWLNRTVATGEMFAPREAREAGFFDRVVAPDVVDATIAEEVARLETIHRESHAIAKSRLRRVAAETIRDAMEAEITLAEYRATAARRSAVALP